MSMDDTEISDDNFHSVYDGRNEESMPLLERCTTTMPNFTSDVKHQLNAISDVRFHLSTLRFSSLEYLFKDIRIFSDS